jgi:hypothetical protein
MSDAASPDFEALLREAFAPVEPPASLSAELEARLTRLSDAAWDELESWELQALRDPRNWGQLARPIAAGAIAAGAGTALVVLRVRATQRRRVALSQGPADLAARTAKAVAGEARRIVKR